MLGNQKQPYLDDTLALTEERRKPDDPYVRYYSTKLTELATEAEEKGD